MTLREKIQNILFDYGVSYKNEEATKRIMEAVEDDQADYRIRMVPGTYPVRYQAYDKSGKPYNQRGDPGSRTREQGGLGLSDRLSRAVKMSKRGLFSERVWIVCGGALSMGMLLVGGLAWIDLAPTLVAGSLAIIHQDMRWRNFRKEEGPY